MRNIYCISGLGADERVFKRLSINGNLHFLPWVAFDKYDDLPCYAQKMATSIPEKNPTILGLSFGGMIATEIAKMMPVKQVFLVSTAKTKEEIPDMNSFIAFLVDHHLMPYGLFKKPTPMLYERFGAETEDAKKMLDAIMQNTDTKFLGWALKAILNWQNTVIPSGIIHTHGTNDKIIPPANVTADYWIKDGSHMMIYNQADDVSAIINSYLEA
jgi:esterase/lipase